MYTLVLSVKGREFFTGSALLPAGAFRLIALYKYGKENQRREKNNENL